MKSDTLLIRHLPANLTDSEREQLLKRFGVINIKSLAGKVKASNIVFARFESITAASNALHRLHQLEVGGRPLTVEYARNKNELNENIPDEPAQLGDQHGTTDESQKNHIEFMNKLNSWNGNLNFTQPPPPNLRYQYPPPNRDVIFNITRSLASVPKFYTQVLHLMNRMNLPSPFKFVQPVNIPEICIEAVQATDAEKNAEEVSMDEETSEEESELESDPDDVRDKQVTITDSLKRSKPRKKQSVAKRRKLMKPVSVPTPASKKTKPEDVFEIVGSEPLQKKIEVKIVTENPGHSDVQPQELVGGFGLLFPPNEPSNKDDETKENEDNEEDPTAGSVITAEQLAANRIPNKDQKHLPVYKNYQAGMPSCRLYIKNLAKQVIERDLHFIYRRYLLADYEEQGSMFDIRLMKEGRMKGQAFVTLQNTKQAQLALNETNGFILKDKPLVVQFARSAVKAPSTNP